MKAAQCRTQELLLRAQARVSWEPWVICVRSYARSTAEPPPSVVTVGSCQAKEPDVADHEGLAMFRAARILGPNSCAALSGGGATCSSPGCLEGLRFT